MSLFLSSLLLLHATNTPGVAFRHYEKLIKTSDWEEKCLKYMEKLCNDKWMIMQNDKPVKLIMLPWHVNQFKIVISDHV